MNEKNEDSLRNLCDTNRQTNIQNIRDPRRREKGAESLFKEIMTENFPNLQKWTDFQIQEANRIPNKRNPKRPHQDTS